MKNYYIIDKEVLDDFIHRMNFISPLMQPYTKKLQNSSRLVTEGEEAKSSDERILFADYIQRCVIDRGAMGNRSLQDAIKAWDEMSEKFGKPQSQEQKGEKGK